jgi:UDP-N-acetylglucosamine 2-epimerase (non-hydrolysing)
MTLGPDAKVNRLKVMVVVGTRPEIIRLSRVIAAFDASPVIELILVHTGQNYDYELNQIFFDDLGLRSPDHYLDAAGGNATETIGLTLTRTDALLAEVQPDAFLVLGDTNSCLSAIAAKKRRIPTFHMEAGNRCFDQRVPEETNRRIVDHLCDINLTYSDIAREYLLREGLPPDRCIKTGSPMSEVLAYYRSKVEASTVLRDLDLEPQEYFVVSVHREENVGSTVQFDGLLASLNVIAEMFGRPIIVSTHPRTRNTIEAKGVSLPPLVRLMKPLSLTAYLSLQVNARAVLSDSGTISEESSILGFPALNLREAHERPEAMEEAAVMMVGLQPERVLQGLLQLDYERRVGINRQPVADYSKPNVSEKVVRLVVSYTDFVNRVVWSRIAKA